MKKKFLTAVACIGLCACITLPAVGCGKKSGLDPETRPLMLATAALDGNFNPFTYTSQNDGDILGFTQIGMFTNDNDGSLICGQNEATVALNYAVTMYDSKTGGNVTNVGNKNGRTEYDIVIKNGIKFSDGIDLTIKDVLFNLYVYLDVAYTGSSTIYSTDIIGLNAYRAQDPSLGDDDDTDITATFTAQARQRVVNMLNWLEDYSADEATDEQLKEDFALTKKLFREELLSDWTALETSWSTTFEENYNFTAAWQAYLFQEGIAEVQTRLNTSTNGSEQIKINDKYVTTLEPTVQGCNNGAQNVGDIKLQHHIDGIAEATTPALVAERAARDKCSEETALLSLQRDYCIDAVFEANTFGSEMANVLQYWATASSVMEELTAQARTEHYNNRTEKVDNVKGITTYTASGADLKASSRSWKMTGETFNDNETYSVLKVAINGIDPKAIFNLAFTVTPMHYYSGTWTNPKTNVTKNYVELAMKDTQNKEFGVEVGNSDFFSEVISDTDKNGVPVGAGAYMASTRNGGVAKDRGEFLHDYIVYFERNPHFTTVGTGINNAIIKTVKFRVTPDDSIMSGLQTGTIDYGTPSAKSENLNAATTSKDLESERYQAGGYGYVGINPKFVPEIQVRQAIMKAMDTRSIINDYYRGGLAVNIWRPMTKTSWAYPENAEEYKDTAYTPTDKEITDLVEAAGYKKVNGIYSKNGKSLSLTFTIAGETKDHPARAMFEDAKDRLNGLGFNIKVSTNSQALKDMTRGNLAVWAAAWSSSIDPDPYQVYHKDSKATSVNNWDYAEILNTNNSQFAKERQIVYDLSDLIDAGRAVLEREDRIPIYAQCLDKIMELAVELPTYQRYDLCIFNSKVLDRASMTTSPSAYNGLLSRIWELNYVK